MKASVRSLEVFRSVMHTGSISKTAVELNVSQPTASGIIKRLEDSIGIRLFDRTSFGLTPTPEATQLLPEIERIFSHFDHMQSKIKNIAEGGNAFLAVQSIPSMSKHFVAPTIKLFREINNKAAIAIHTGQSTQVINNIEVGSFDVGFVYGERNSTTLETVPLRTIKFNCIVRKNSKLADKEIIDLDDLNSENLILNRSGTYLRQAVEKACQRHKVNITSKIEAGTMQAYDLVNSGVGIGILDSSLLSEEYYPGLVSKPTFLDIESQASLIFNKQAPLSIFARQYIELVKLHFGIEDSLNPEVFSKQTVSKLKILNDIVLDS